MNRHAELDEESWRYREQKRVYPVNGDQASSNVTVLAKQMAELQSSIATIARRMDSLCDDTPRHGAPMAGSAAVSLPREQTIAGTIELRERSSTVHWCKQTYTKSWPRN